MTTDDATLQALLGSHPPCPMFILGKGPRFDDPETQPQQWEHARHMVDRLRDGSLAIVCAIFGDTDVLGIAIAPPGKSEADLRAVLETDPAVKPGRVSVRLAQAVTFTPATVTGNSTP